MDDKKRGYLDDGGEALDDKKRRYLNAPTDLLFQRVTLESKSFIRLVSINVMLNIPFYGN
ncbi:MAG: hypothetical protein ACR5K9_09500 [Wolbachia sp.]